jgi:hypothetical protein
VVLVAVADAGERVMAHTSRCSGAKKERCDCSCNGELHGGSAGVVRLAAASPVAYRVSSPDLRAARKRARSRRGRAVRRAETELQSWLAAAANTPDGAPAVTQQTVGVVSDAVANAVVEALNRGGYHWTAADHVVCAFLAAAARAMQELQDQFEDAAAQMVSDILTARREHRPAIPEPLAKVAAQAAVYALTKLSAVGHFDDLLRATRMLAVMVCPAPEHHRAVVLYCLSPLEKDIFSDETRQELTRSLPRDWVTSRPGAIS